GVVLEHAVVGGVGDVEVAACVHRNSKWQVEAVRAHAAVIRGIRSRDAALPEDQIGGSPSAGKRATASGEWGVVFENAVVYEVRDVEVAACVHGDPAGEVEAAQAQPAVVRGIQSEAATLPEH